MITTIIFDFDGTLLETTELVKNSFKHICQVYNKEYNEEYILSTFGEPLASVISRDYKEYDVDEVLRTYRNYQEKRFDNEVSLYDSVYETLKYLYEKEYKLGIATSRLKDSTLKALEQFDIAHFFKCIITADDVVNPKPHKEPLEKAMILLDSKPKETMYVGDASIDMICAQNAGVLPALVGWQSNSIELAKEHGIKHLLSTMKDLISIVQTK
ncbi:pyrophosphatase PpaX [Alkalibaculum bacchi]|jgi:pyrophosphatase PpaX|uniref:Pyrophosphatase PpaX n=1 Tax=Alkalibaculum bacchi TaxID=645887 RepID=A0A366I1P1_9FIRM|nr:HAD-IA family hydrolase [Alkalibaculum bacchi]RBP61322.1 pyrophosphatase PpaX [Alkalibaculum bacchi]